MRHHRRPLPDPVEQDGFDMTPMIDCTFQLILFFMLVTDMARERVDPLHLPAADRSSVVNNADDLVVNVLREGQVRVAGKTVTDAQLEAIFEARRPRAQRGMGYPVVLRADRSTPFERIQAILSAAVDRGAVTRIQFSAKME